MYYSRYRRRNNLKKLSNFLGRNSRRYRRYR